MITFDPALKLAILSASTTLDVVDLYSRWKDWVCTGNNSKYLPAMTTVGGEDIDPISGIKIPAYVFLINGWRVRPQESNHTLSVINGVLLVAGGGDPFVNTLGNYVVRVNYQQPVQAITVATAGGSAPSAEQVASAVLAALQLTAIPVDLQKIRGQDLAGTGVEADPWRPL